MNRVRRTVLGHVMTSLESSAYVAAVVYPIYRFSEFKRRRALRRFRLALWVLGREIPEWAKR